MSMNFANFFYRAAWCIDAVAGQSGSDRSLRTVNIDDRRHAIVNSVGRGA